MDKIEKYLAYNGKVSLICANTKNLVEEIRKIHDLTPTTTATMGRFATVCGMMGLTSIKENDDSITVQLKGTGPCGILVAVVKRENNISKIKTYMQNPLVELPLKPNGKIDVGGAVGNTGYLNVIKQSDITDSEYNGLVPLVSGEIAEDFTEYFATSEQKPTVLALGVLVNKDGVQESGGYMINLMPDATEEEISKIEEALNKAPSISELLSQEKSLNEIAKIVTGDDNIKLLEDDLEIKFDCDCSKQKIEKGLISIGKEDLNEIIEEDGKAEIVCQFCNKKYDFSKEELEEILKKI